MELEIYELTPLFEAVQVNKVFADGKTFVDCVPKDPTAAILQRYLREKDEPGFSLKEFTLANFELPKTFTNQFKTDASKTVSEHIQQLWEMLTRQPDVQSGSLIPLPHPYVVPGGRFGEIYYWDSYFTMLGLEVSGKTVMIENMIDNFSFLIDSYGYIPNGNRTYFLGRSQPPFYASMVNLLGDAKAATEGLEKGITLKRYLPQLEKEYRFWMQGQDELSPANVSGRRVVLMPDGSILNRYWDESDCPRPESYKEDVALAKNSDDKNFLFRNLRAACESGWDFSSRWYKRENEFTSIHTTQLIPVDLNCLLYNLELTLAEAYQFSSDDAAADKYISLAGKRKNAINTYCWDNERQFYFDYDHVENKLKKQFTLAAAYPLFFQVAGKEMAANIVSNLEKSFLFPGGLQTTTNVTGQQWDSPNGWAPLQWICVKGLLNYGYHELARNIAERWTKLNEKVYNNTGKMMEKYNVVSTDLAAGGGEYESQDGFGWTNGVYLAFRKLLEA